MSIELVAPNKYRFQDLVCIDLALQNWDSANCKLFIEPKGGEYALFERKRPDGKLERFEIQVKGSADAVGLDTIASCLAHCPRFASSPSLFERLHRNTSDRALLVMSGRCTDESLPFLVPNDWAFSAIDPRKVRFSDTQKLVAVYAALPAASSSILETNRRNARGTLARQMGAHEKRAAISRLFVREQCTESTVRASCQERLVKEHRVPLESAQAVLSSLCEIVAKEKGNRGDAMPGLRQAMEALAPDPLRPAGYILRGDESRWMTDLLTTNALLLSGPPRCGKTDAGRYIAGECQRLGYEVRVGADVDEAKRFLFDLGKSNRVFLLDDPLGGTRVDSDAGQKMSTLRGLLRQLRTTRKLIVCQNQYQLFSGLSAAALADCSLEEHRWFDLGDTNRVFLLKVWTRLSEETRLPQKTVAVVRRLIEKGSIQLEPGVLKHLAYVSRSIDVTASEDS